MRKFIYTRLHRDGYGFYVEPKERLSEKIHDIVREEGIFDEKKQRIVLFHREGNTIVGVHEELPLKDFVGRARGNFVGYQLEPGEPIPYFEEVKNKLDAIHNEVLDAHAKLDESTLKYGGKALQDTVIVFREGLDTGTAWDAAVKAIRENLNTPRLFIGNVQGEGREHSVEPKARANVTEGKKLETADVKLSEAEKTDRLAAPGDAPSPAEKKTARLPEPPKPSSGWQKSHVSPVARPPERLASKCVARIGGVFLVAIGLYTAHASARKDPYTGETKRNWVSTVLGGAAAAAGAGIAAWGLRR